MKWSKKTELKPKRQSAILDILNDSLGSTQEDIREYLKKRGIKTSQSTLSRDLREMGAVKVPDNGGKTSYRPGGSVKEFDKRIADYSISYEAIGNFLVIKTAAGGAPGFCVILDRQHWSEIAGTIAGDDTILVIGRTPADIHNVITKLNTIL
jgi:transcriptional regulator of arginine metabolism